MAFYFQRPEWTLPEASATPETVYLNRRRILRVLMATAQVGVALPIAKAYPQAVDKPVDNSAEKKAQEAKSARQNSLYALERPMTEEKWATRYNNFYEFSGNKDVAARAARLSLRPWSVVIDGLVEKRVETDAEDLIRFMPVEERLYRHRCVEGWAMAIPWTGFPLRALLSYARPLGSAKYLAMQSFMRPEEASAQRQDWYPWPYLEALTIAEASHDLAFIATGIYGKPLPPQSGAPLRLAVPWKYGFKSIKSIVRFTLTDKRPVGFWQTIQGGEYGFWANVNPDAPHPRWSQATERWLGRPDGDRMPTRIYNGYGAFVADLYRGLENEPLFL